jgi:hypothetical protein
MSFLRGPLARRLTLISIALLVLSGCVSVRAYPDPGYSQPSYRELRRPLLPGKIAITAEFRTLGSTNSEVSRYLLDRVVKILYASGLFESVTAGPTSQGTDALAIMIDNYRQPDFGEGFRAGYTSRGKEPSPMIARYLLVAEYLPAKGQIVKREYPHGVYQLLGQKTSSPPDARIGTIVQAFDHVVEDLLLKLLIDLQAHGYLGG